MLPAVQVVDDLEMLGRAVVDARRIGEHEEGKVGIVAQHGHDVDDAGGIDLELDGVLVGPQVFDVVAKPLGQAPNQRAGCDGDAQRTSPSQRIRCGPRSTYVRHSPRRCLTSSWSFIIP